MSSSRRQRIGCSRSEKGSEGLTDRDEDGGERSNKKRKRKLSDMLGPIWTKDNLKLFYQVYLKHGKDWKKVAAIVHNRTPEMVEALYNVNKAYLSLPETQRSATGLIAMMTDHYNMLVESRSDADESSESLVGSDPLQQLPTQFHKKLSGTVSGDMSRSRILQIASCPSSYGGPSPAKKPRSAAVSRPRIVGKRTPRIPVVDLIDKKASGKAPSKIHQEDLEQDSFGDCDANTVETVVALTLAAASQRAASPQISCTPASRTDQEKYSCGQNGYVKDVGLGTDSGGSGPKNTGSNIDGGTIAGSQESRDTDIGVVTKANTSVAIAETNLAGKSSFFSGEVRSKLRRGQKLRAKKVKVGGTDSARLDDLKEECSCTDEGQGKQEIVKRDCVDVMPDDGVKHGQLQRKRRLPPQRSKKRSRQLFSGDESSGLDALATLADLSLNGLLPSPRLESELPVKIVVDNKEDVCSMVNTIIKEDADAKLRGSLEVQKKMHMRDARGTLMTGAESHVKVETGITDLDKNRATSIAEFKKRRRKGVTEKIDTCGEQHAAGDPECKPEAEPLNVIGEDVRPRSKLKRTIHPQTSIRQLAKPLKQVDVPLFDQGHNTLEALTAEAEVEQVPGSNVAVIPVRQRSRRKAAAEKTFESLASCTSVGGGGAVCDPVHSCVEPGRRDIVHCSHSTAELGPSNIKARLTHCLSSAGVRRWCSYEWFYSAIDLPWFTQNEFVEYLNHAGLGHVPRLTRVEWGVIRSSLGKPRRLSKRFLQEEREKLQLYRESVRKHYHEVRTGHRDGLPTDLPRPLTVGQRVIAHHPKTREIHDGSILTVDRNRCRVQFDRPELGVELVSDIDAMPVNALENLSEILICRNIAVDGVDQGFEDSRYDLKSRAPASAGNAARAALNERLERPQNSPVFATPSRFFLNALCKQAQAADTVDSVIQAKAAANEAAVAAQQAMHNQPCTLAQVQAREADVRALADLTRALDKKEALLVELRNMNDDADISWKDGELVRSSESFQKQYATILLQLKEVNSQVCAALLHLRQRNRYQENAVPPWHRSSIQQTLSFGSSGSLDSSVSCSLDYRPSVGDLAASARKHAKLMVTAAVQAMSSVREGEDALVKIGGALKSLSKVNLLAPSVGEGTGSTKVDGGMLHSQISRTPFAREPLMNFKDGTAEHTTSMNGKEMSILTELMASCVATLLTVQSFTEKQFPPAEVAMVIDSILASMQPHALQNHSVFKEIEYYTGLLKNQIVALIPTQSNCSLALDCPPSN